MAGSFMLPRMRQDLAGRRHAPACEADRAIGADEIDRALDDQAVSVIELRNAPAFVDDQRKWKLELVAEAGMLRSALRVDAEDVDSLRAGLLPSIAEIAELLRASRSVVTRIKDQHDVAAS